MDKSAVYQIIAIDYNGNEYPVFPYYSSDLSIILNFAIMLYHRENALQTKKGDYEPIITRCIKINNIYRKFIPGSCGSIEEPRCVAVINRLDNAGPGEDDQLDDLPF